MKEANKIRVLKHADNLIKIFKLDIKEDDKKLNLCRALRRLEARANKLATQQCNGEKETEKEEAILNEVDLILRFESLNIPLFFNGDCRGYGLKIEDNYVRDNNINISKDWGGFGIIAPDLSEVL